MSYDIHSFYFKSEFSIQFFFCFHLSHPWTKFWRHTLFLKYCLYIWVKVLFTISWLLSCEFIDICIFYWLITLSFACNILYLDFCIHYGMIIIKGMVSFTIHLSTFTHFAILHSLSLKLQFKEKYFPNSTRKPSVHCFLLRAWVSKGKVNPFKRKQ